MRAVDVRPFCAWKNILTACQRSFVITDNSWCVIDVSVYQQYKTFLQI